jgi:hypothetical protein
MTRLELKQARTIALTEPDDRGNVTIIVNLDGERSTALASNLN